MSSEKIGSVRGHKVSWDERTKEIYVDGSKLDYKAESAAIALEVADQHLRRKGK